MKTLIPLLMIASFVVSRVGRSPATLSGSMMIRIAKLWRAIIPYSHFDSVNERWGYPGADRQSALKRLRRLGDRPQFICQEGATGRTNLDATREYLKGTGIKGRFTFQLTGFRNHNDAWLLRPSPAG